MSQQGFGRRQSASRATAEPAAAARDALATGENRSAGKSMGILAAVGGLAVLAAIGGAVALSASTSVAPAAPPQEIASSPNVCLGQTDCANQYSVALSCGSSEEARTVSVIARDAEAAERKAERYNRECRARSTSFIAVLASGTATRPAASAVRPAVARQPESAPHNASSGSNRTRVRFRRR
jgi:hypothetical protein